jgi:DNA topoisomerase-1
MGKWNSEEYLGDFSVIENCDNTNPHEAIRVTHIETEFVTGLEARAQTLYRLIWKNTLESCMAAAHYKCSRATISAPLEHAYTHVVEVPVFLGWKIVSAQQSERKDGDVTDDQNAGAGLLMYFKTIRQGSPIPYVKIESVVVVSHRHSHYTESSLIKKLEDLGIGRPSTFSMIVDTIVERGYVKKTDIVGITKECNEFVLRGDEIECRTVSRVFGSEKNKLVIQPIGIAVAEFLTENFTSLFDYDYTKTMEDDLDKIASANIRWNELCEKCDETIKVLAKPLAKMEKPKYIVKSRNGTQEYEFVFHQYGASLKYHCGEETLYKAVNPKLKIDLEDVKAGKYMAEDLLEIKDDYLGKYQDADMYIKTGKFGPYVQWGDQTAAIKGIQKPLGEIVMADVVKYLDKSEGDDDSADDGNKPRAPPKNINVLRNLNADLSIRKGKYGPYIYYMPMGAKSPQFFKLTKFKTTWATSPVEDIVQWICETYVKK